MVDKLVSDPIGVILDCTDCGHMYEPSWAEWEDGRTDCPACGGWLMAVELLEPRHGGEGQ